MVISIHAAREGGDLARSILQKAGLDISIHAAREGGDGIGGGLLFLDFISIHAAREGGDRIADYDTVELDKFQSTPPVKAATDSALLARLKILHFNPRRP